jgi:hypothetical protein
MLDHGCGTKITPLEDVSNSRRITPVIERMPYEFKDSLSHLRLSHNSLLLQFIFNECSIEQVYQLRLWVVKTPDKSEGNFLSERLNILLYPPVSPGFIVARTNR